MSDYMPMGAPRIRFNWGYHEALADARKGRPERSYTSSDFPLPHWDPSYCDGYREGFAFHRGERSYDHPHDPNTSSEPAWRHWFTTNK